jgi:undecaprenyl-diphosphatase
MTDFDFIRATVLALIQGLTEFLPVSSSAHLILPSVLLGWEDQGLAFDVAVHLGTLLAVVVFFRRDLYAISAGCMHHLATGQASDNSKLGWYLLLATLPVVIAGFILKDVVDNYMRDARIFGVTTIIFGLLLWVADRKKGATRSLQQLDLRTALIIGFSQMLALIPGVSRSGITTTAALMCNLDRDAATRFSFLLAIPVIAGAALLLLMDLLQAESVNWYELGYALVLSMLTAFACIHYFLRFISRIGFLPFVIYRMILGCFLLFFVGI